MDGPPPTNAAAFDASGNLVFARIAARYDLLCDLFSFGFHRVWKARMAKLMARHCNGVVLDVAAGTGDIPARLSREMARLGRARSETTVLVTDICPEMLVLARRKLRGSSFEVHFQTSDAHDLREFADNSIDVLSISFAMKICDRSRVLAQAWRVLRPGGALFCLEAARIPFAPVQWLYLRYMDWCLPLIAQIATGGDREAYQFLLKGIHHFPAQQEFASEIESAGFTNVTFESLTLGIVALHCATKAS